MLIKWKLINLRYPNCSHQITVRQLTSVELRLIMIEQVKVLYTDIKMPKLILSMMKVTIKNVIIICTNTNSKQSMYRFVDSFVSSVQRYLLLIKYLEVYLLYGGLNCDSSIRCRMCYRRQPDFLCYQERKEMMVIVPEKYIRKMVSQRKMRKSNFTRGVNYYLLQSLLEVIYGIMMSVK
ncbi:hypothetical protein SS50377_21626 [Spironucleus salmonicida]|uniref:Uncharacterized protein n=1 Tax=Spironucleus salmonicida TaxID=348837 RepID=V6LPR7_9EUKA|nr:hypothetical protein SS50377_21626 [Spironucleus salmonicida]|eukprot:EST42744.1 Hypothetical protein SS50377_17601 [Spironucleus salmonicida]